MQALPAPAAEGFLFSMPSLTMVNVMERSDPYKERARELAIASGYVDPDIKIDRPGQKPWPAWCQFRQAAREEHMARETAAAGADIAANMRPQLPAYQNSPLKVIGAHDAATVQQMRNCMSVGNAVAGVICADGHLGYAQPVGGVIAYEKQISISGVGFDIGCGNMAVRLDTPFSAIEHRVDDIAKDVARVISFGIGEQTPSVPNTRCSTTATRGKPLTWKRTGRRLPASSARSVPAITMSICCATKQASSGSAYTSGRAA